MSKGARKMAYQELYDKYTALLSDKAECQDSLAILKQGYISTKRINGNTYTYLQYRINGKLKSEYVKDDHLPEVCAQLDKRRVLRKRINEIDAELKKLESAAGVLDKDLYRKLTILRRCAAVETMPLEERAKSLAFGSAMTALEGIPLSRETEQNLSRWIEGDIRFLESFLNTLQTYHLAGV